MRVEGELESRTTLVKEGKDDEDVTSLDTIPKDIPPVAALIPL